MIGQTKFTFFKIIKKFIYNAFIVLTTKNLNPSSPRLSNSRRVFLGWISIKLCQCLPGLLCLSALKIANGYFAFFFFYYYLIKIYISCYWMKWIYILSYNYFLNLYFLHFQKNLLISKFAMPLSITQTSICCFNCIVQN